MVLCRQLSTLLCAAVSRSLWRLHRQDLSESFRRTLLGLLDELFIHCDERDITECLMLFERLIIINFCEGRYLGCPHTKILHCSSWFYSGLVLFLN